MKFDKLYIQQNKSQNNYDYERNIKVYEVTENKKPLEAPSRGLMREVNYYRFRQGAPLEMI